MPSLTTLAAQKSMVEDKWVRKSENYVVCDCGFGPLPKFKRGNGVCQNGDSSYSYLLPYLFASPVRVQLRGDRAPMLCSLLDDKLNHKFILEKNHIQRDVNFTWSFSSCTLWIVYLLEIPCSLQHDCSSVDSDQLNKLCVQWSRVVRLSHQPSKLRLLLQLQLPILLDATKYWTRLGVSAVTTQVWEEMFEGVIAELEGKYCHVPGIHARKRQKGSRSWVLSVLFYCITLWWCDVRRWWAIDWWLGEQYFKPTVRKYLPVHWG